MKAKSHTDKTIKRPGDPRAGKGGVVPPKNRQFGQPEGNKQGRGFWKREDTARYKLEKMLTLPVEEVQAIAMDSKAPLFERRIAKSLLNENAWKVTESMINQVYGAPRETQFNVTAEADDKEKELFIKGFILP